MDRNKDWRSTGIVPETPQSSSRVALYEETSFTPSQKSPSTRQAHNSASSDSSAKSSQEVSEEVRKKRRETTNKLIQYSGRAASDILATSFRGADKLNPYLREIAKLADYPNGEACQDYDWDRAKRDAKVQGWKVEEENRGRTMQRTYDGLGRMGRANKNGSRGAVREAEEGAGHQRAAAMSEVEGNRAAQRLHLPNGKLRRIENTKPRKAPSLQRDDTYTMDLTEDD